MQPTPKRQTAAQQAIALRKAAAKAADRYQTCESCGVTLAGLFPGSPHRCNGQRRRDGGER
jgi:hypothetical protein